MSGCRDGEEKRIKGRAQPTLLDAIIVSSYLFVARPPCTSLLSLFSVAAYRPATMAVKIDGLDGSGQEIPLQISSRFDNLSEKDTADIFDDLVLESEGDE